MEPTSPDPDLTEALMGSTCAGCANVAFPVTGSCQQCGAQDMLDIELSRSGTVWGFTVQRFAPKSPPYVPPAEGFRPFAVGYVELAEGVKVEAVLDCQTFADLEDHAVVHLTATAPVPRFATATAAVTI
jgi:uncharacterized OB-fold protein